ncbi:hypothetical protein QJS66_10185 [Kocuria rhizophila]|nr:hypothetical protein QJS66_10185 [Kocuria rhizophila]
MATADAAVEGAGTYATSARFLHPAADCAHATVWAYTVRTSASEVPGAPTSETRMDDDLPQQDPQLGAEETSQRGGYPALHRSSHGHHGAGSRVPHQRRPARRAPSSWGVRSAASAPGTCIRAALG